MRGPIAAPGPDSGRAAVRRAAAALLLAALAALLAGGCRRERVVEPGYTPAPRAVSGLPRTFMLGFSALPSTLDDEAYAEALDLAAAHGELLLIQRAPSWADFLPGAEPSARLLDLAGRERRAVEERGLALFYALDPFDPAGRADLAALPAAYPQADLSHPDLRAAFAAEARFVAAHYRPRYLALGVEVNATFERSPGQYAAYLDAYRAAWRAAKDASPETLVFATFQYEQLLGAVPWEPAHPPRWELLDDFAGRLDLMAVSTFPSLTDPVARRIPPDYYRRLRERTGLPVAFASAGFASAPGPEGRNSSTPAEQRRYLQRLLGDAEAMASPFVVWFAGRDLAFAVQPPFDLWASIGLRDASDRPKEAWAAWAEAAARPWRPPASAAPAP